MKILAIADCRLTIEGVSGKPIGDGRFVEIDTIAVTAITQTSGLQSMIDNRQFQRIYVRSELISIKK